MMICGIDPGKTGAIAFLYPNFLEVHDTPVIDKELNGPAIADLFREFTPEHVFVEAVNSFGMGRQSAFNFGQGMGVLKGVLATLQISYTMVSPNKWKKHFALNRDKSAARMCASRLFPKNANDFLRKKDDGRAEASLIARYGSEERGRIY
jgi:crossover junction endodeoxyribonuclease RuvC